MNLSFLRKWAERSLHPTQKHVCIVTRGGSVVSIGTNGGDNWRHAEQAALGRVWKSERPGCTVHSFRIMKGGNLGMARPCDDCMSLIIESGIKKIEYSDENGQIVKEKVS